MNTPFIKNALSIAVALTLTACSGQDENVAGIGGSGVVSSGSVTGFGSVFVNGVEFETDSAIFDVDGVSGTQADLAIGMLVRVSGSINDDGVTGTASSISFDDELQGPISAINAIGLDGIKSSLTILGTTVIIDSGSTTFDISGDIISPPSFDFASIAINNNVEISGFFDSNGDLLATRVELKDVTFNAADSIVEVEGTINNLTGTTFHIGGLTIDASAATLDDLPNGLVEGQLVEIKGTLDAGLTNLTASKVEAEDNSTDDTDEFELEGLVTNYNDVNKTFTINGINVDASNATREPASLTLTNDLRIEVEGAIVNGTLVAEKIKLEGGDIKVHAKVTAVPPATAANTFAVSPVSSGQAIIITVSTDTQFEDEINEDKFFNLDNLVVDDFVEVQGFEDDNSGITATEVELRDLDKVVVQGNATAASGDSTGGTMTVLGVEFDFDDVETDFEDENDAPLSSIEINDLIDSIRAGTPRFVKIEDDDPADGTADEIDLE